MRRITRTIQLGNVKIGSGHPIPIQTMTKTDTRDIISTINQIKEIEEAGREHPRCCRYSFRLQIGTRVYQIWYTRIETQSWQYRVKKQDRNGSKIRKAGRYTDSNRG